MKSLTFCVLSLSLIILPTTSTCHVSTPTSPALTYLATINLTTSSPLPIGAFPTATAG
jgi:hypothetical protein